jgi:hypothetical protein
MIRVDKFLLLFVVASMPFFLAIKLRVPLTSLLVTDFLTVLGFILALFYSLKPSNRYYVLTSNTIFYFLLISGYLFFYIISIYFSKIPQIGWIGFRAQIGRILLGFLIVLSIQTTLSLRQLFKAIFIGGMSSVAVSMLKMVGLISLTFPRSEAAQIYGTQYAHTTPTQNFGLFHISGPFTMWYSFILIFLMFSSFYYTTNCLSKIGKVVFAVLTVIAIILSNSRNCVVSTTIGVILVLVARNWFGENASSFRISGKKLLLSLVLFGLSIVAAVIVVDFILSIRSLDSRLIGYEKAFAYLRGGRWFWGIGPNVFRQISGEGVDVHNAYLSVWVESGFIPLVIFCTLLFWTPGKLLIRQFSRIRKYKMSKDLTLASLLLMIVISTWLISILFFPARTTHEIWIGIGMNFAVLNVIRREEMVTRYR